MQFTHAFYSCFYCYGNGAFGSYDIMDIALFLSFCYFNRFPGSFIGFMYSTVGRYRPRLECGRVHDLSLELPSRCPALLS